MTTNNSNKTGPSVWTFSSKNCCFYNVGNTTYAMNWEIPSTKEKSKNKEILENPQLSDFSEWKQAVCDFVRWTNPNAFGVPECVNAPTNAEKIITIGDRRIFFDKDDNIIIGDTNALLSYMYIHPEVKSTIEKMESVYYDELNSDVLRLNLEHPHTYSVNKSLFVKKTKTVMMIEPLKSFSMAIITLNEDLSVYNATSIITAKHYEDMISSLGGAKLHFSENMALRHINHGESVDYSVRKRCNWYERENKDKE